MVPHCSTDENSVIEYVFKAETFMEVPGSLSNFQMSLVLSS